MSRKTIHFDLNIEALKKYYNKSPTNAYLELRNYLQKEGFENVGDSDYISKKSITYTKVQSLVDDMLFKFPWLHESVTKLYSENVTRQHNLVDKLHESKLPIVNYKRIKRSR